MTDLQATLQAAPNYASLFLDFYLVAFKNDAFPAIINLRSSRNGNVSASSMTVSTGVSSKSNRMTDASSNIRQRFFQTRQLLNRIYVVRAQSISRPDRFLLRLFFSILHSPYYSPLYYILHSIIQYRKTTV